jgi:hypothetical protein
MAGKLSIYKYCKTGAGSRYYKAAFYPNGKIKPVVSVMAIYRQLSSAHTEMAEHKQCGMSVFTSWRRGGP